MNNKRCFIYVRVSTKHQADEGYSIPEQIERLKKYAEAMNWTIVKVYTDGGYSGANTDRPAFQDMIEEIEKGNADVVLVDKIDRFARSLVDTVTVLEKVLEPNNVAFVSRAEAFDSSSQIGKACLYIMAIFAEIERTRIKERMADGKAGRAKEGKYKGGGSIPIGYDYNPEDGSLEINEYEAMQVREVFDLFNKRTPVNTIKNIMNEKGYRTKYGEWKEITIRGIITNKVHIGMILHKGVWYEGLHDGIIPTEVFNKAQAIMEERKRENEKYRVGKRYCSPLGGLIWCAHCSARYHWRRNGQNKDGSYRAYYICYSRAKTDKKMVKDPNCRNKTYRDRDIESIIYGEIRKLKTDPSYFPELKKSVDNSAKRAMLEKRVVQIDNQLSKLMDLYTLGDLDLNVIKSKIAPLSGEKKSLESEIKSLEEEVSGKPKAEVLSLVEQFNEAYESGDTSLMHDIIAELIDHIEIDGEDIRIHWNF